MLLLLWSLVGTVTEFRRSVDPFELDLLKRFSRGVCLHRFSERDHSLFDTGHRTLEQNKVILHLTIADEATNSNGMLANTVEASVMITYGVMVLLTTSNSVAPFFSSLPLPIL